MRYFLWAVIFMLVSFISFVNEGAAIAIVIPYCMWFYVYIHVDTRDGWEKLFGKKKKLLAKWRKLHEWLMPLAMVILPAHLFGSLWEFVL